MVSLKKYILGSLLFGCLAFTAGAANINLFFVGSTTLAVGSSTSIQVLPVGGTPSGTALYEWSVGPSATQLQIVQAYSTSNTFVWTPTDHEGTFVIRAQMKSSGGDSGTVSNTFTVTSRVTNGSPVISTTNNPLVAFYSMPACPAGQVAYVTLKGPNSTDPMLTTNSQVCDGTNSVNLYVAGMRPSTTYSVQQHVLNGTQDTPGPQLSFTSGAIASSAIIPSQSVTTAAAGGDPNNTAFPLLVQFPVNGPDPFATDLQGNVVWYMAGFENSKDYLYRAVPGGTFLGSYGNHSFLVELDLAGNVVRATNIGDISSQLQALGANPNNSITFTGFTHDAFRFPNGDTAFIMTAEETATQGGATVPVLGDIIVVVDSNLQVKWWWNEFDHLNVSVPAVLNETCQPNASNCGPYSGSSPANDWTHTNSLSPTPDGNLIISIRHLDMIVKLNYNGGNTPAWKAGQPDNTILWVFGNTSAAPATAAHLTVVSTAVSPLPTHQHDVDYAPNAELTLYDNGNTRVAASGGHSRGQGWIIDDAHLTATLIENQDLGVYSFATGAAELLSNGNYHFYNGFINPGTSSNSAEYTPSSSSGSIQFADTLPSNTGYRTFRMASLSSMYPTGGEYFVPVIPCRVVDTRLTAGLFGGPTLAKATSRAFPISSSACGVPVGATAYSVNVTAVPKGPLGYISVWPDGQAQPYVSTLNSYDGRVKANAAIIPAGNAGAIDVYASDPTDVVIDITGYFAPTPGLAFYPLTPCRVFDSRNPTGNFGGPSLAANEARDIPIQQSACSVPANAQAYALNLTAVPKGPLGYLTAFPSGGTQPYVSNLNSYNGTVVANAAIIGAGTNGDISVFVSNPSDVVVDINGYFAPPASGGLRFYNLSPCRVLDTRNGAGAFTGVLTPTFDSSCGVPNTAQGLVLNATVVPTKVLGYLSLWEAGGPQPYVSTLNSYDGSVTSNMAIVPANSGSIEAYASNATQLILDASGYFAQ